MSREVDSRVVEMQFNNENFEKNTKQTIGTIDKLMEKLQFKGAEKGFEKLDAAAEDVDFSTMQRSLDTLESKFSTLNIVATTALMNITNKFVDAGEKMVKSLSFDQVMSGWNKYVEKTGNIQTIMNATGDSIDTVNGYLNKLMWYSDETSFSFNEMTSALSQMTASGGDIKKMIPMIMGIANATADAGKSGFAFQSTIRNLTQSYSAGHLQLQDWKSLNLMGTATKALKQELIDTAVELGTLKKGEVTIGSFESSLSKKWANTKVMEKTFEKYASMMEAAYEMTQKNPGMTSSEALEKLSGQYGELAERSALAAQQAKSFSEAIDSTKDAVSSKWMRSFELIFGNKEEATDTWTELANRLYDIFVPPIDALNERLSKGLDSGWQQLLSNELGDQADAYSYALEKVALASGAITQKQIDDAGSFGNAIKQGGISADLLKQGLDEAQKSAEKMLAMSDKELAARGASRESIEQDAKAFAELNEKVQNGTLDLDAYATKLRETSGREHLIQSVWNLMDAVNALIKPIHEAFQEIFPPKTGEQIHSIAQWLDETTKKLIITDDSAKKIKAVAEGVFSVLRVSKDILEGIFLAVGKIVTAAKPIGDAFLDAASSVGKFAAEIANGLHPLETISTWATKFVDAAAPALYSFGSVADKVLTSFAEGAKNAFNEFDPEKLNQFILGGMGASMLVSIKGFLDSFKSIGESAKGVVSGIKDCIESLGDAIDAWGKAKKADTLMTIAKAFTLMAASLAVLSMVKPERLAASIGAMTVVFGELLGVLAVMTTITKSVKSLKFIALSTGMIAVSAAVLVLAGALKVISTIGSENLLTSVLALGTVMVELTAVAFILSKDSGRFMKGAAGTIAFAAGIRVLASAVKAFGGLKTDQLVKGLVGAGVVCAELVATAKLLDGVKFGIGKGTGFVLVAASMEILQNAVQKFGEMDTENLAKGLVAVGAALLEFVTALNFSKGSLGSAISLTIMAGAINLLVPAFQGLGALSWLEIGKGLAAVAGAFTVMGIAGALLAPLTPVIVALSLSLSALALSLGALLALSSASQFVSNLASSLSLLQNLNFQVFLNGIKAMAWMLVEFIAGVFKGLAEISSSLVTSIAAIIKAVCDAIVLAAPAIGTALYVVGTTVIDTAVKLIAYVWEKIEPALNDLWDKFQAWAGEHSPFDPDNWGGQEKGISEKNFVLPFADILDELKNGDSVMAGIYKAFTEIGKNASEGMKQGQLDGKKDATNAAEETANAVIDTSKDTFKSHSPSRVMAELGRYVTLGLAEGISDPSALAQAKTAMLSAATAIRNVFTTFWGIHSPSDLAATDAENIIEGAILGIGDKDKQEELRQASYNGAIVIKDGVVQALDEATLAVQDKMKGLYVAFKAGSPLSKNDQSKLSIYQNGVAQADKGYIDAKQNDVLIPGKTGIKKAGSSQNANKKELAAANQDDADAQRILKDPLGVFTDWYNDKVDESTNPTGTGTSKGHSGTSKSTKTAADKLADEYSKKLKANKAKMDAADKEYKLWEATSGDTATAEELLAKKTESLTTEIANQTDRVAIAKEQYDKIVAEASSTDTQKSDAYATLLDEQTTLADLQHEKQETLFKAIKDRYDNEADTATDEYELWSALYEDTASVEEKSNKKIANIDRKLAAQAKVVTAAEDEYTALKAEFGEKSAKTQEAYRQWLEEQTAQQNLINEMNKAQLDAFDDALVVLEKHEKLVTNRQNMLAKIYGDGDLSQREEAYKAAVEKYGENSKEARKAATQGTMTAIIGVGTALDSMSYSLKKVTNRQTKYTEAIAKFGKDSDEALDAYADLQSEQYNFVGFAENLAGAFEMDDSGKRMMMQLGYAISRNWKPIQNGFKTVMAKVQRSFPQLADKMAKAFGVATGEGFTNVVTDIFGVITAAVSGDWGQALTSGITAILDFAGSDFGQKIIANLAPLLMGLPKVFGELAAGGKTLTIMGKAVTVAGKGVGSLGLSLGGLIGEGGVLSKIISTVVQFAANLGPEGWIIAAIVAGVAVCAGLIIKNWDKVVEFFQNFGKWVSNLFSNIWNGIKKGFEGIGNFLSKAWEGTKKFVSGAIETGKNFVKGLGEGIKNAATGVVKGVKTVCSNVANAVKNFWGIHSPSTVMAEMGGYICAGLAKGITDSSDGVNRSMEDVMSGAEGVAQMAANSLLNALSTDDADEPLIRPVVDLSDVQNGADWINTNLGEDQSFALSAERSAGLAGSVAWKAAQNRSAALEADAPDPNVMSNRDIVESVQALGEHVDGIAEAVRNMKLSLNGRQLVGGIIDEVDVQMGKRVRR